MSKTYLASKKIWLLVCCVIIFFLSIGVYLAWDSVFEEKRLSTLQEKGTKVVALIANVATKGNYGIIVVYQYTDSNGMNYNGDCGRLFKTRQEAEAQIGKTIEIYIDGKGNSIPVGMKTSENWQLVWAIVLSVIVCGLLTATVILSVKIAKEKKLKKQQAQQS